MIKAAESESKSELEAVGVDQFGRSRSQSWSRNSGLCVVKRVKFWPSDNIFARKDWTTGHRYAPFLEEKERSDVNVRLNCFISLDFCL